MANTTTDLEAALSRGGIEGPYVMVGHSLGGYESLLFADRRRSAVPGMVLVDPGIPDHLARIARSAPAILREMREITPRQVVVTRKLCGGNRSDRGAHTQQILASVVRTAHQRQLDAHALMVSLLRAPRSSVPTELRAPPLVH